MPNLSNLPGLPNYSFLTKTLDFNVGSLSFSPSYLQAGAVIFLVFLLILTMASMRRHFMTYTFKGAVFGIFFGFILTLILEGFLIISGKTAFTEILGWETAPKPVSKVLDVGRNKLVDVLGITDPIPSSNAKTFSSKEEILNSYQSLSPADAASVRKMICIP